MNIKRFIITVLVGFAFVFGFDALWHGHLLMGQYEQTASLWRSTEEMQSYFPYMMLGQFFTTLIIVTIYTRNHEGKGIGEGLRFGLLIGLLLGVLQGSSYAYMPITANIALMWLGGGVLLGLGLGLLCSLIYKS